MSALRGERDKVGRDDMVTITNLTEQGICENLRVRYAKGIIYTSIGAVLVAMNPYKDVGSFNKSNINKFKGKQSFEVPPHVFQLAEDVYKALLTSRNNQAVIISGESGAGKTESAKGMLQYIAAVTGAGNKRIDEIKRVLLESNPLLESFGNAKTLRNNNSSRFGKYMTIQFDSRGDPEGGKIRVYLLEKSRIVTQVQGERCFHIFYQMFAAGSSEKQSWAIDSIKNFNYLNKSTPKADGINDSHDYSETRHAMKAVGMNSEMQDEVFRLLAAVLHIGNINFKKGAKGAECTDPSALERAAYYLDVPAEALHKALVFRSIQSGSARGTSYDVGQDESGAGFARDALAKGIYTRLFDWIVHITNKSMSTQGQGPSIGLLDIFGFEIFEDNSLEQLFINYTNESLQQVFINLTLKQEQDEYNREGIPWQTVQYFDNEPTVQLLSGRMGVFALLDEECLMPQGNDQTFMDKLRSNLSSNRYFKASGPMGFQVKHYAGDVHYDAHQFLLKNRDTLFDDLKDLCSVSQNRILAQIFSAQWEERTVAQSSGGGGRGGRGGARGGRGGGAARGGRGGKARPVTAGVHFKRSLAELVKLLYACQPHYIRCIKPNDEKRPLGFTDQRVAEQVRYLGLLENLRVRRAGYCYRCEFKRWLKRYGLCSQETFPHWSGGEREGVEHLMKKIGISSGEYAFGKTKLFVKEPRALYKAEEARVKALDAIAETVKTVKVPKDPMQPFVCLDYLRILIFEELDHFTVILPPDKEGNDMSRDYMHYGNLESDYQAGVIKGQDIKASLYTVLTDQTDLLKEHVAGKQKKGFWAGFLKFFGKGKQSTARLV